MSASLGFGEFGFGEGPFGSNTDGTVSALPALAPEGAFNVFCAHGTGITNLLLQPEVNYVGAPTGWFSVISANDLMLVSGGLYPPTNARADINVLVSATFTLEGVFLFTDVPPNFSNVQEKHCFFGVTDAAGASVGLFVSEIGLLYTGAVRFSGDNIVLDSPAQALPDSASLVTEGEYYTVRLVVNFDQGTTYVYWTRTSEVETLGHQLKYILPTMSSAEAITVPPDQIRLSVRGTVGSGTSLGLHSLCFGSGLLIPNLAPRADAGLDQAVRTCAVIQLDGAASFDPEGAPVTYSWRLLDAPVGSQYVFDGFDAVTVPLGTPTGFTNLVHSAELAVVNATEALVAGDLLVIAGEPYSIVGTGVDGGGFYATVANSAVADNLAGVAFKLLRQHGISGATTEKPTFLPDVPGLFKFDLIVFDGGLYSEAAVTIVNVTESPIPRGLVPDCRFLWGYLSDFWKLVEGKERIETFWSALAQVAASELLNLWQLEYSKSLRDIQRTFQRRWLRYDLLMTEDPLNIEDSSLRAIFGGIQSTNVSAAGTVGTLNIDVAGTAYSIPIAVMAGTTTGVAGVLATRLQQQLRLIDAHFSATVIAATGGGFSVRINAPFVFSVLATSTLAEFSTGTNTYPRGTGIVMAEKTFRVDRCLSGLGIVTGDFLVLGDSAYRIAFISTNAVDDYVEQRITTVDVLPTNAPLTWSIAGQVVSKTLDFWSGLVSTGDVVVVDVVNHVTGVITPVNLTALGACSTVKRTLGLDASLVGAYLLDTATYGVFLRGVLRRKYLPVDSLVTDVPYLREKINNADDSEVLRRNVDYFLERFRNSPCLRFVVGTPDVWQGENPPHRLWAETTYLDNRPMIEANFGIPAGFTLDNFSQVSSNLDYLSAVRGLWFSYFNGPTLFNLRAGVQILLGLPFAEEKGVIEEIRTDFSTTNGRILVRDVKNTEVVRSYSFPVSLELEVNPATGELYEVGDTVEQFAPLVEGAEVVDYIKEPRWIEGYVNQGTFYEVEKYFKFLVRVDSDAFNLSSLLFAQSFIRRIKPTYTHPVFIVQSTVGDAEVSVSDEVLFTGSLNLHAGPHFGADGQAQMWDQARPGGGGYWNQYDQADPNGTAPTFPTADTSNDWAFDQYLLAPEESIFTRLTTVWAGGLPVSSNIFYTDVPVFSLKVAEFSRGGMLQLPGPPGIAFGLPHTVTTGATINKISVQYQGLFNPGGLLALQVKKNGVVAGTCLLFPPVITNTIDPSTYRVSFDITLPVVPGDVLEMLLEHDTGINTYVGAIGVVLGVGETWDSSIPLAAGTYHTYLIL